MLVRYNRGFAADESWVTLEMGFWMILRPYWKANPNHVEANGEERVFAWLCCKR